MNFKDRLPKPLIVAHVQAWFGPKNPGGHIDVGYDSRDPDTINHQIDLMEKVGIGGACINWYGSLVDSFTHTATQNWFQIVRQRNITKGTKFKLLLLPDAGMIKQDPHKRDANVVVNEQIALASKMFFSSPDYFLPYVPEFEFPSAGVDMAKLRSSFPKLQFLSKNEQYTWVEIPGGVEALKELYRTKPIVMGSFFKGFDDVLASWRTNRILPDLAGKTLHDSLDAFPGGIPLLGLATWNDYEEGTAMEGEIERVLG